MKKKACKQCKMLIKGDECPVCKNSSLSTNWQGRMYFKDVKKSEVAKEIGVSEEGEYAIKVR